MAVCPACGKELPGPFPFCPFCTEPLSGAVREQRKIVTVLFCDLTGSTALGESLDAEALRAVIARYYERMKGIVELHGGTVAKFIGDAVMAVFGVPAAHEDDALRACRAAAGMREALPGLGVLGRIGVNTGEVVIGNEEWMVGDTVNVAARLEQAAEPGEVLLGVETMLLVQQGVEAEPVEPLELKGKRERVPAFRLVSVLGAPERSHGWRFVGREHELEQIAAAWVRAGSEHRCQLVTVVGDAGVGKSRLVAEALAGIPARVVRGRCLPYGEGITYWPVVEVVKQLEALPSDPGAASSIRSLLRESDQATSAESIAWAFRKLLEEQAPLVVVFDDIQWGEETLLDLIEGVALFSSGASLLILCMARPELLERRPAWEALVRLGPLPADAVDELIGDQVTVELRSRIAAAAGGNPLFLTEMLAIAGDTDEVEVPPTLRALLSARLDLLDPAERRVLECGSVEGELFHRGGVHALAPEEMQITPRLAALVRRELIRSDQALFPGDDGFRFRHLLIRDAAYESLPKSTRAELHTRFADWLEQQGAGLVELDEILGYHLEQAARYRRELGRDEPTLALAAADRLAAAGRRALWRGDSRAAANLLERSLLLSRPNRLDVHLELDLAEAFAGMNPERALVIATEAADRAAAVGDVAGEALARACAASNAFEVGAGSAEELEALTLYAQPMLEEAGDHAGLVHVWRARYDLANARGRFEEWVQAAEQARDHSRLAGEQREQVYALAAPLVYGPRPADDALRTLDGLLPEIPDPWTLGHRAQLLAMLGRFAEAWPLAEHSNERLRQQGSTQGDEFLSFVAELAGDRESARAYRQARLQSYEERNVLAYVATIAPRLGLDLCALGRFAEAEPLAHRGRELGDEQDMTAQALWRQALARVRAHQGNHAEAEVLAREAVEITEQTDGLYFQANALSDLGEVLAAAGRTVEATQVMEHALERHERKKNLAMIAQLQPRLEALQNELAAPGSSHTT